MMPPDVTAAQAGGFETDAEGNIIRDAEGNPIPKITGETVETIADADIETARPTGYKRDKDGELILSDGYQLWGCIQSSHKRKAWSWDSKLFDMGILSAKRAEMIARNYK